MTSRSRIFRLVNDDDRVFKALADPTRRFLLDSLFARDGRTLTELESELEMTRFGVMKHLRVLEDAVIVLTRLSAQEKLYSSTRCLSGYIYDRWIDKYTERRVSALADLKHQLEQRAPHEREHRDPATTQVYRVYIKASPDRIWQAITDPSWTARYGYGGTVDYDLRPGGKHIAYTSETMRASIDARRRDRRRGRRSEPPNRLVVTWRMVMDETMAAEGFTRLTLLDRRGAGWRHEAHPHARTRGRASAGAAAVRWPGRDGCRRPGWSWVLSDISRACSRPASRWTRTTDQG